jgi:hypothetical protein
MEEYLKTLNTALSNKIGGMVSAITELEMGVQARDQELRRLYEQYEPERLQEAQTPAPELDPEPKGKGSKE